MTWLFLSWAVAVVIVCFWVYGASANNSSDLSEGQVASRMRNVA